MKMDLSHDDREKQNNLLRLFKFIVTKECIGLMVGPKTMNDGKYEELEESCERFVKGLYGGFTDNELIYLKRKWVEANEWYKKIDVYRVKYGLLEIKLW